MDSSSSSTRRNPSRGPVAALQEAVLDSGLRVLAVHDLGQHLRSQRPAVPGTVPAIFEGVAVPPRGRRGASAPRGAQHALPARIPSTPKPAKTRIRHEIRPEAISPSLSADPFLRRGGYEPWEPPPRAIIEAAAAGRSVFQQPFRLNTDRFRERQILAAFSDGVTAAGFQLAFRERQRLFISHRGSENFTKPLQPALALGFCPAAVGRPRHGRPFSLN